MAVLIGMASLATSATVMDVVVLLDCSAVVASTPTVAAATGLLITEKRLPAVRPVRTLNALPMRPRHARKAYSAVQSHMNKPARFAHTRHVTSAGGAGVSAGTDVAPLGVRRFVLPTLLFPSVLLLDTDWEGDGARVWGFSLAMREGLLSAGSQLHNAAAAARPGALSTWALMAASDEGEQDEATLVI